MMKMIATLMILVASAALADEVRLGAGLVAEVPLVASGQLSTGEVLFRELVLTVGAKTSHAVQIIVRDPATGLFWTFAERSDRPLTAASVRAETMAQHRFAIADGKMIVFRLQGPNVLLFSSERSSGSLAAAVAALEYEVQHELATTWPITGAFPKDTAIRSVSLGSALPWQFLADSQIHPSPYRLSADSLAFSRGRWILTLRNEKGAVDRLCFSQSFTPLLKK